MATGHQQSTLHPAAGAGSVLKSSENNKVLLPLHTLKSNVCWIYCFYVLLNFSIIPLQKLSYFISFNETNKFKGKLTYVIHSQK